MHYLASMNNYSSFTNTQSDFDTSDTLTERTEASLLQYARRHGLSLDFMAFNPLASESTRLPSSLATLNLDTTHLVELPRPADVVSFDEKWHIDQRSALFLRGIVHVGDSAVFPEVKQRSQFSRATKVESLLLRTDADLDQRSFRSKWETRKSRLHANPVDSFIWDEDLTSQLYWPGLDLPAEAVDQIKQEKLQLGKDDILFLQQCASTTRTEGENEEESNLVRRRQTEQKLATVYQTPPLLPLSSPFILGIPDSPVSRMRLATSPEDPTITHGTKLEQNLDAEDFVEPETLSKSTDFGSDNHNHGNSFSVLDSSSTPHCSSPFKRKRPENLKLEVPLSPAPRSSPPMKKSKTVSFPNDLCMTIPDYAKPFSSEDPQVVENRQSEFFENVIRPHAESALQAISNEQLKEANSTTRVEVPLIDQSHHLAPWEAFSRKRVGCQSEIEAQKRLISMLKHEMIKSYEVWPSVVKVDKAVRRWKPFDMRLSGVPEEEIETDSLDQFVVKLSLHDSTTLGWKPDGLRTLDVSEDHDDELDQAEMILTEEKDTSSDTSVPRVADACTAEKQNSTILQRPWITATAPHLKKPSFPEASQGGEISRAKGSQSILGDVFSASTSLDRFMQVHTGKAATPKAFNKEETEPKTDVEKPPKIKPPEKNNMIIGTCEAPQTIPLPLPTIESPIQPRWFMSSSTLFERRSLIKEVKRLNTAAESIERDFASSTTLHGSNAQKSECEEADMIIAPGHGLLLTTLQKIKQRSLPGQVNRNILRERILRLGRRYERLIVLVSEDCRNLPDAPSTSNMGRPLDDRDCNEIASLVNFSSTHGNDIQVLYAPGDEAALATWIVSCMSRFGLDDEDFQLVQEETFWEVFLRKGGMDAFAAQAILSKLKRPESLPPDGDKTNYGLPAFIKMSQAERIKRFGRLMGGEKVLRRVSMVIDSRWTPAAPTGLSNSPSRSRWIREF